LAGRSLMKSGRCIPSAEAPPKNQPD
jgi:hypothetical protein